MISTVTHHPYNINNLDWDLKDELGHGFEDYIYKIIVKMLHISFSSGITVCQTEAVRDGGRDIIIEATKSFELFGINFSMKGKKKIKIYIECKSTNQDTVSYDKFAKNAIIAGQDKVDYLLLVTNKTITPYTFYSVCENAAGSGYEFLLIDQYILYNYLKQNGLDKWNLCDVNFDRTRIAVSYQTDKGSYNRKPCMDLYLFCRNYADDIAECELTLATDWNWKLSLDKFSFILEKNKGKCIKLKLFKEFNEGTDDIVLHLKSNNHLNSIDLNGKSLSYNFELPLTGEAHKTIISKAKEILSSASSFLWLNLYGEAGVGKTRITDELNKFFLSRSVRVINCVCVRRQKEATFTNILGESSKILKSNLDSSDLFELLLDIKDDFLWTALFIEDIHNADIEFLKMLESVLSKENINVPIILVTTGRSDYTVFNENYFSLLEKFNNEKKIYFHNYNVKPFTDDECVNLIRRTIKDIPEEALNRLHKLSNNNPFYLVHFIEYLLEIKLVNLLNRNTVGIPNVLTFAEKIYIPKAVEDLLEKRYQVLRNYVLGEKCQNFLKSAALYGLHFPKQLLYEYFDENEYTNLDILFLGHFIKDLDDKSFSFDHETVYLFFKNKVFCKSGDYHLYEKIYSNKTVFSLYEILKQGVVLYHLKDYNKAKKCFEIPILEIKNMDNVSSENISVEYFEYFEYIYEIFRRENALLFMKKTIQAKIYVAMHNLALGQATQAFDDSFDLVSKYHKDDEVFFLDLKQLQASFYLHVGRISESRGIMNDLLARERMSKEIFSDEIRFNLFERASSLYIHSNHIQPAIEYNKLSFQIAEQLDNDKLKALAKINEAKLWFFSNVQKSRDIMLEAKKLLDKNMVSRINCHNELGILTADILIENSLKENTKSYIKRAQKLLENSIEINYPLDIIRSHFILAILNFITPHKNLELCKKHLDYGIDASVRYGILKLMGNFYNLKALIGIYEDQKVDDIVAIFNTMINYLKQEDLLFLGNLDFSYSNVILLTNYLIFLNEKGLESQKYQFLSQITYYGYSSICDYQCDRHDKCQYTCSRNIEKFQKNFENIKEGSLLLVNPQYKFPFIMDKYFYPIYL